MIGRLTYMKIITSPHRDKGNKYIYQYHQNIINRYFSYQYYGCDLFHKSKNEKPEKFIARISGENLKIKF